MAIVNDYPWKLELCQPQILCYIRSNMKEIRITPSRPWWQIDFKELWDYRELLFVLAWRDVTVKYKQTLLGVSWVVFQPVITTGIFSIFFGKIAKIPSDGLPYPLFVLIGLVFWNFFSAGVSNASNSLLSNSHIITKVYFPRVIVILSAILTAGVDFLVTLVVLVVAILFYGYLPSPIVLLVLPAITLILLLTMAGLGLFAAAVNVRFRDVRYILPFFIQIGLYVTPVIYPLSAIYDYRKWLLMLNPLTGVIESARIVFIGKNVDWGLIGISFMISLVIFVVGLYCFRATEDVFVDIA